MRLENKKTIITGAASGIGKAIALAFADEGADVAILDIDMVKAREVAAEIEDKGREAVCLECDVGYADPVDRAIGEAVQQLGGLNVLVNNTGIIRQSAVTEMSEEEWDLILRTNLKSVFLCSRKAAQIMIERGGGGRIISISSIHAVISEPSCGHYTAAKGGIEAFSRTLASELAPHKITVNFIRPGATYTELTIPMYTDSVVRALYDRVPMKEIAQAVWIASGAVFLASDESRYMTGQDLTIDGGYTMNGALPGAAYWEDSE
jgi:NAD(P)-dependent dehydrogenase (short-subunit alcohol dehydrogenase family)